MIHLKRSFRLASMICASLLLTASTAEAATELGEIGSSTVICDSPASYVQSVSTPPGYEVPAAGGVITSWSTVAGVGGARVRIAVMRPTAMANQFLTVAASAPTKLKTRSLNSFPTSLSTQAGDLLGLLIVSGRHNCVLTNAGTVADAGSREVGTVFEPGTTGTFSEPSEPNRRLNLSAMLEADEDGDGIGDEPPTTKINYAPKARARGRRVSFGFESTDPGATFKCNLDSGGYESCSSPARYSVVAGKHEFALRATDPDGNRDRSPATARFRVVER